MMIMKRVVYVGLLLQMLLLLNAAAAAAAAYLEMMNSSTSWCGGDGCFMAELEQPLEVLVMEFRFSRMLGEKQKNHPTSGTGNSGKQAVKCGSGKQYGNCLPGANKNHEHKGIYHRS